jgi:hypothetical protein
MKKINIMNEAWDYLIILDACRYDFFSKVWKDYLHGDLYKKYSVGSSTVEWRNKSFPGRYNDVIYISSNPNINSVKSIKNFNGSDHFFKVFDLWNSNWDEQLGTVRPDSVTDFVIKILKKTNKRAIIHYLQPHAPYIYFPGQSTGFSSIDLEDGNAFKLDLESRYNQKMEKALLNIIYNFTRISNYFISPMFRIDWKMRQVLSLGPASPLDAFRRENGKEALRKAYNDNLILVLNEVKRLINHLHGKVIITADHGELLGENGFYGHANYKKYKELIEIPWLVLEIPKSNQHITFPDHKSSIDECDYEGEDIELRKKLSALGYVD